MQIFLASDHAGFYLKEIVKEDFIKRGFIVEDYGADSYNNEDDYPDFIHPCVKEYIKKTNGDVKRGICIIFGGSGTGEAIVANRFRGARAVVYNSHDLEIIRLARMHNDANILSVGARFIEDKDCLLGIKVFMTTIFESGRHAKRILKTDMLQY